MTLVAAALGCAAALDHTPPRLTVDEAPGVVRAVEVRVEVGDDESGLAALTVAIDDGPAEPVPLPERDPAAAGPTVVTWTPPAPVADGEHAFTFVATDRGWTPNEARATARRTLDATPPKLEVAPSSAVAHQGKTWALWVRADEPLVEPVMRLTARGDDNEVKERTVALYPVEGAWRGLRGIELQQEVGPLAVEVEARDAVGNVAKLATTVQVEATAFEEGGFIKLNKKQTEARKDQAAIDKMRADRNGAYAQVVPEQHWSGPFVLPIPTAKLTSPFGKYRSYSDGKKSHHTGLDLSEERGTPVGTAAGGVVLVAHEMAIFGNVVIVHHGQGVCTSYNHLDEILVAEGATVAAGQVIGKLGSTGQSTGPHLHWGMEVGEVAVDPGEWLTVTFDHPPAFGDGDGVGASASAGVAPDAPVAPSAAAP